MHSIIFTQELESWTSDFSLPSSVWLSGFFNPQSFLTAIMQVCHYLVVYNQMYIVRIINIVREDLSLSIKSAGHKTQLLVGQTNIPATSQEYWQLGILEER